MLSIDTLRSERSTPLGYGLPLYPHGSYRPHRGVCLVILARTALGYELDQISNDIGMTRQNVECGSVTKWKSLSAVRGGSKSSANRTRPRTLRSLYQRHTAVDLQIPYKGLQT